MIRNIFFYNHFQHGDLALSRGLVKWIYNSLMTHTTANPYTDNLATEIIFEGKEVFLIRKLNFSYFINKQAASVHFDFRIKNIPSATGFNQGQQVSICDKNTLCINTWIGSSPAFIDRANMPRNLLGSPADYVSDFSFLQCIEIIEQIKNLIGIELKYPKNKIDILPRANFFPCKKNKADYFLNFLKTFSKKILICNGKVMSRQTPNFCIRNLIKTFIVDHPDIAFLYTSKTFSPMNNEFFIDDYCDIPNLNEIDYVSTFCDAIITRRSGPGEMIQTHENFFDPHKTIISLYDHEEGAFYFTEGTAKLKWTNNYTSNSIISLLADI